MGSISRDLVDLQRVIVPRAAGEQGGILSGSNPTNYNANDPIQLWVIQVVIIISLTQLLALILARIRQPRVISEVIGGVLLGPTVMGRIPHFRQTIFPESGMPLLNLTSTIGLVLFLFLVGLEIDTSVIKRNIKASTAVSVAGLLFPLGLGAALGVGVYKEFIDPAVNFGYFILFTAIAIGITAFPVLCRILTELKLLDTPVGVVTLSAGVGNDVIGWILLALSVALVNASTGLTALWVLLTCVGFVIFLLYPVRFGYVWLCRRTGSLEQGTPTTFLMTVTLLLVFACAFFTDVIGVHAIFGGFLAGLIIPHENGFAISLVEKIEDLVSILLLPIYFTLSGLKTDLGLLDNGVTWGYTIIICLVAFTSKFVACSVAAFSTGFNWREAGAIGSLMSCKGLVELIVLNIGLQAGILNTRVFSMFVVHALILTFITTPLTILFYPPSHRVHSNVNPIKDVPSSIEGGRSSGSGSDSPEGIKTRFAIILDKIEQLPAAMTLAQLLQPPTTHTVDFSALELSNSNEKRSTLTPEEKLPQLDHAPTNPGYPRITIDALRLIELTNRTSAVLKSQAADSLILTDPVVSVFRTFGFLNRLLVSATLSVVAFEEFASVVSTHARDSDSQMVLIPWCHAGPLGDGGNDASGKSNPFDGIFTRSASNEQTHSVVYSELIRSIFHSAPADVGLFVDRGIHSSNPYDGASDHHIFLPFFGGPDDRLALTFVVQLCSNPNMHATVIRMQVTESPELTPTSTDVESKAIEAGHPQTTLAGPDTVYANNDTHIRMASDTADNLIWQRYTTASHLNGPHAAGALTRISFATRQSYTPLHAIVDIAQREVASVAGNKSLLVVVGRSRRMAVVSHQVELKQIMQERGSLVGSSVPKTLGDVGAAIVATKTNSSLLIMQAQPSS